MGIKKALFLGCAIILASSRILAASAETRALMRGNPTILAEQTDKVFISAIDDGYRFLARSGGAPSIKTHLGVNGDVSVGYIIGERVVILEYSKELQYIKTVEFKNEWGMDAVKDAGAAIRGEPIGLPWEDTKTRSIWSAFTKDDEGNYYLFHARVVKDSERDVENMVVIKYDSQGRRLKTFRLPGGELNAYWPTPSTIEISGDRLATFFGKYIFTGADGIHHQASTGFILDKNSLERLNMKMPSVSHSMNRQLLPIEGGYALVDQCDASAPSPKRAFTFAKIGDAPIGQKRAFLFKEGKAHQETFAKLGGLAQSSGGYIFAGAYEKNNIVSAAHNDSRNLFLLTMDEKLENIRAPLWLTNYTDKRNDNVGTPKIVALGGDRFLIMWERMGYGVHKTTYAAIVDKNGKRLTKDKELPGVRLNINDVLRYNKANGNVFWAVNGPDMNIDIYSFNPDSPISVPRRKGAPGGGYGLSTQGIVSKNSFVARNEVFAVEARFYTYLPIQSAVPAGLVGAALTDNSGGIVEIIGTARQQGFNANPGDASSTRGDPSAKRRAVTLYCLPSKAVKPGAYRLRLAYKPDGKKEWRIITRTGVTSVPLAVTTKKANTKARGGYGLILTDFIVKDGRSSASHGEKFPINLKAAKVGTDAFPAGQIGVALADKKGNIVEVINTRDWKMLEAGEVRSQNMSTVTVPKSVARGKYRLMVVARPAGGKWEVVTMARDGISAGIDFTVR